MFPCSKCGACCRRAAFVASKVEFPYKTRKDGSCEKLIGNECSVYKTRPDICRIDRQIDGETRDGILERIDICNIMIREDKMDRTYLIDKKPYL